MKRHRHLVAWDIAHPRRLQKVRKIALDFGNPLQKSVFVCELTGAEKGRLQERLAKVLKPSEDQVVFLDLGHCEREVEEFLEWLGLPCALPESVRVV